MDALVYTLLAVSGLLGLVSLLPALAKRLRLPYTVVLAAAGVGIGLLIHGGGSWLGGGPAGDFIKALGEVELSSAAFLYIFLPVLLFETALAIDVRRLLDDMGPVLLLAIVAVLVCTAVAGLATWWAWGIWHGQATQRALVVCLLLASIIATTDPAAVVGIFRDLGAPRRLSILVEGESLFNDAAAIVLSTLLLTMLTRGGEPDLAAAGLDFLVKFLGGAAVGWVMGWTAALIVTPLRNQAQSEITLTLALAYLSFILAEHYLHVSGVVAVVLAGLVMASRGRTRLSPESWRGLEHVWGQLGFWANSLIFLFASMLVPPTLLNAKWSHLALLAALVTGALVARALVVFGLLPILGWIGASDRISVPYRAVMTWGGLRGAVSLALALAVTENRRVPDSIQDTVAVVATGFVLFTLFVQGTSLRPLIGLLGIDKLTPIELNLRNRALGLSLSNVRRDLEEVAARFGLDTSRAIDPLLERGAELAQEQLDLDARYGALSVDDRLYIGLSTLARYEEQRYLAYFHDGLISRLTVETLTAGAGQLQDGLKTGGPAGYDHIARKMVRPGRGLRAALWLHRRTGVERPVAARLSERFAMLIALRFCLQELELFTTERLQPMLGKEAAAAVRDRLAARMKRIDEAMEIIRLQYPAYIESVEVQYLIRAGLRMEERATQALFEEALISREILNTLERDLRERRQTVEQPPQLDLGLATHELVARVPLFSGLSPDRLKRIERLLRPRLYFPGEPIVRRGERGDTVYFISSGAVTVEVPGLEQPIRLGTGDFFGEIALVMDQPRNADVTASAYCQLLLLDKRDFNRLYNKDPVLKGHIDEAIARRLVG
ncbi:cyclic nucleotide-binding domain-containing protein [Niveispirillum sp. SYP-B3756]|uniref:cation:proton antiporter n=1 Tax=Niveispirillum sp. SYP-B3756 TaxID=2662178 RepID=UPI0012916781|nr:cation:proton antiporter [Niveispirillum sp. SYP-B3756]MQP67651.1 cyclic nucleotide-binding domain-containing protein [Niveispirillum sp. SYP-B3756]